MSDVKIPISADVKSVQKAVEDVGKTIDKVNRTKWNPIDLEALKRDLAKAEQMMADFRRRTGAAGAGNLGVVPTLPQPTAPATPPSAEVPDPTPAGTRGRRVRRRGAYTHEPDILDVGRSFMGGVGGGFATIGGYATRGAYAGGHAGGGVGAGIGLLRGLGIGALAFGALKAGQGLTEGYGMAKERAMTLDSLKRQMGDLGTSFEALKSASQGVAFSFGVNSKESAKLMEEFSKLSRGADKTEESLMQSTITSGRAARAYGMDPRESVQFFAGMRHIDPKQNNRELALLIAEASQRSGMTSRVDEVMQSMQSFFAHSTRMSLSAPNMNAYAGAYADLVGSRMPGMTSEAATSMLGAANASMMQMGGNAGEAGMAFTLAALNRHGSMNPIQAAALAQGGLFATRRSTFGPDSAIGKYMGWEKNPFESGKGADVSNFEAVNSYIKSVTGDKWIQMELAKNLHGVGSLQHGAALLGMSGQQGGGLLKLLQGANIDLNSINESGLQTLAEIGDADKSKLDSIFGTMIRRGGSGALNSKERERLQVAKNSGDTEMFRLALAEIAAIKDQEQTEGKQLRDGVAKVESAMTEAGNKLIRPLNDMRDAMLVQLGYGEATLAQKVLKIRQADMKALGESELAAGLQYYDAKEKEIRNAALSDKSNSEVRRLGTRLFTPEVSRSMREGMDLNEKHRADFVSQNAEISKLRSDLISKGYVTAGSDGMTLISPDAEHAAKHGHPETQVIRVESTSTVNLNGPDGKTTMITNQSSENVSIPKGSGSR